MLAMTKGLLSQWLTHGTAGLFAGNQKEALFTWGILKDYLSVLVAECGVYRNNNYK